MEEALQPETFVDRRDLAAMNNLSKPDQEFVDFVQRRSRFIFRIAYSVLRNTHDAEDVVQDTFLKLHRSGAWRNMRDESAFLARTAWRIAVDRLDRRGPIPTEIHAVAPARDPEPAAINADTNAVVHKLIDALPEELRQPLALSAVHELDSGHIAGLLGIPEGTVRTRIMRARNILKQKLANLQEGRNAD